MCITECVSQNQLCDSSVRCTKAGICEVSCFRTCNELLQASSNGLTAAQQGPCLMQALGRQSLVQIKLCHSSSSHTRLIRCLTLRGWDH